MAERYVLSKLRDNREVSIIDNQNDLEGIAKEFITRSRKITSKDEI